MNDPVLFEKYNVWAKRDALMCLEEYASQFKWKKRSNNILDVGCGDGTVTNILKKYIPTDFKLLGCDISEKMVNFANKHHCNEQTSFTVQDIEGDLPEGMKGKFDHVFSSYTMHWIIDQERAFKNIYELLNEDGECFTIFLASMPVYDVYRVLARNNKWSQWVKNVDKYVSPYHDSKEPENEVREMLEKVGFVDFQVECRDLVFEFEDINTLRKLFTAINPFQIPPEKCEDFMADYLNILKRLEIMRKYNNNYDKSVQVYYSLLIVYASKPATQENFFAELNKPHSMFISEPLTP